MLGIKLRILAGCSVPIVIGFVREVNKLIPVDVYFPGCPPINSSEAAGYLFRILLTIVKSLVVHFE
uniref:F-box family protein n=1 Tax=Solanum tuberosum TaxID=4113 RepID=M0ZJX1_SOLTU